MKMSERILLISPTTFEYYKRIQSELSIAGYECDWLNEIPGVSVRSKVLARYFPRIYSHICDRYFVKNIEWTKTYRYILVIKGEGLSVSMLKKLKRANPSAATILYLWDSLENVKGVERKLEFFDSVKSFDQIDCDNHSEFTHLPLFYAPEYSHTNHKAFSGSIGAAFVGTLHSDRYTTVNEIAAVVEKKLSKKGTVFFYFHSKILLTILKYFKNGLRNIPMSEVSFEPMSVNAVAKLVSECSVIIDIAHSKQTGLSMRTIESVGMNKKLITNNANVKSYDFYKSNNIYILNGNNNKLEDFLEKPIEDVPEFIREKYALKAWVSSVLIM